MTASETAEPGRAWCFGDDIDTDQIIPSRFLVSTTLAELGEHAFNDLRPEFTAGVTDGDVVVAGANFGSGSSREHAPLCLRETGIDAVIAESFARIFFRNAINIGLPVLICPDAGELSDGDEISVRLDDDVVVNHTTGERYGTEPLPPFLQNIVESGGLKPYTKAKLDADANGDDG